MHVLAYAAAWLLLSAGVWLEWPFLMDFDAQARKAILDPALEPVSRYLTHAGDPVVMLALSLCLLGVLVVWKRWDQARLVAGAVLGVTLFRWGVLWAIARPRPDGGVADAFGWSYPSGHTAYALTAALLLLLLVERPSPLLMVLAFAWPATVAATRVLLGVHWPIDVLAGWTLALIVVGAISHLARLTPDSYPAKTVRRQLHSSVGGEVRSKSGADPQR